MNKVIKGILLFLLIYGLFSIAGFLFPIDQEWYNSLDKPSWTPPGSVIGIVWAVLFAFISLSIVLAWSSKGEESFPPLFWIVLIINYVTNQLFSFFQFEMKDLLLATVDTFLVAVTTGILIILIRKYNKVSPWLLVPYLLWTTFATYLAFTFYRLNPTETFLM
ncbi:membrane protein [Pontibacillus chungwhensis BH030062]|uniref:Membrane protein n=1 Tax=Pontibacillus chungwhensis BH030062 TaxID=1385513 RepID=A0A0A2UYU8_9BACI|nr:tryptophan-rich sensory protein [Pontibacillus chungwhensis]KGP91711.1 membrane protein [Pontibacillus chungwhensis BH030062]